MAENNEPDPHAKHDSTGDRVGDILRKERITRRIALETIAKDLKLNVKYIKALEANEYNALPAEPYIRVYFRSLAKYLMLDPEEILKRFYEERGIPAQDYSKDASSKITISMVEHERPYLPWVIIVGFIAVLAMVSFVAKKAGWITASVSSEQPIDSSVVKNSVATENGLHAHSRADSVEDSLLGALIPHNEATRLAPAAPATASASVNQTPQKKETATDTAKLVLDIRSLKDSVWIQVFADGQSSRIYLYANQSKRFTARDSLNVHVGNNSQLHYTYNGKPLTVKAKDIAIFKLSKTDSKPEMWNLAKWAAVFKDRT
jgi:cytoskeletal protein RodZ